MKNYNILYFALLLTFILGSCKKDEVENETIIPGESYISIQKQNTKTDKFEVELSAADSLITGYNKLFLNITDLSSGKKISNADISFMPKMNMISMSHSAPFENPSKSADENGYFEGAVVFIMPSNPDEGWTLRVAVDYEGVKDTVVLNIPEVKEPADSKLISLISSVDKTKYFISFVQPEKPKVGINDIEFTVHYKKDMMSFPVCDDFSITITPEMPSMGHGSPNNENPVLLSNGHYTGKLNLTMTGWWKINLTVKKGDELLSEDAFFDLNL